MSEARIPPEWEIQRHARDRVVYRRPSGVPISIEGCTAGDSAWAWQVAAALLAAAELAESEGH